MAQEHREEKHNLQQLKYRSKSVSSKRNACVLCPAFAGTSMCVGKGTSEKGICTSFWAGCMHWSQTACLLKERFETCL